MPCSPATKITMFVPRVAQMPTTATAMSAVEGLASQLVPWMPTRCSTWFRTP